MEQVETHRIQTKMKALGGKTALGTSEVVAKEQAAFTIYRGEILALAPINSEEKAAKYREIIRGYMPAVVEIEKKFTEF